LCHALTTTKQDSRQRWGEGQGGTPLHIHTMQTSTGICGHAQSAKSVPSTESSQSHTMDRGNTHIHIHKRTHHTRTLAHTHSHGDMVTWTHHVVQPRGAAARFLLLLRL
jgi:hypothetical protein